ncbi:hypothetical protein QVD17_10324 [Tagetes erecta]|uniref:ZCF37 n=1 Tax=Tagetes erecta TaxID=13708 RepID=A0AAD8P5U3_TARER|nr:hypothetical protein QVD17_10324 [Tagetes erecta]
MSFICGSFRTQDDDDYDVLWPCPTDSPRKISKKRQFFSNRRDKNTTNPYSDRGLDKFEALLADLDKQRQKIFTQKGSEDVSMVKFIYKSQNEIQPIVVKLRDQRKQSNNIVDHHDKVIDFKEPEETNTKPISLDRKPDEKKVCDVDQCKRKLFAELWKPSYYLPLFVMLILVLLMFSGRSFAILCTSIGWYMVPIVNEMLYDSKQKKEHVKRSRRAHKE